jgi:3-dehydroquinate dehydratase/shikimate dehydrogenase
MRVASILCKEISIAKMQIQAALPVCDVVELRLDYLEKIDISDVKTLHDASSVPVIFTLRTRSQGGQCNLPESARLRLITQLAALHPDYLDLEYDTSDEYILAFKKNFPTIQLIGSYHDFEKTPDDLEGLFLRLHKPYFDIFKMATTAHSLCDTLRLLIFLKKISQHHRVIGMAMGEQGQVSRIVAPIVGSLMTYGCVDADAIAAPGQLTLQEMTDTYHVQSLDQQTIICALLGDPVSQSAGHVFHNQRFLEKRINAVYVKLKIPPELLSEVILLMKQLPFKNFSVTIPHKETVMLYLDKIEAEAKAMGAVNTIAVREGQYAGFNTDGMASVDVLSKKMALHHKKILILGAGGSARAIAYALMRQGAETTLCNRTLSRAQAVVKAQGGHGHAIDFSQLYLLETFPYTVILNTLPQEAFAEQCRDWVMPRAGDAEKIAMDIVLKPQDTLFLERAARAGYLCIAGDALYQAQALRQLKIWFD